MKQVSYLAGVVVFFGAVAQCLAQDGAGSNSPPVNVATLSTQVSNLTVQVSSLSKSVAGLTNRTIHPIRVPEDLRFLAEDQLNEYIIVKNGKVHDLTSPFLYFITTPLTIISSDIFPLGVGDSRGTVPEFLDYMATTNKVKGAGGSDLPVSDRIANIYKGMEDKEWMFERTRFGILTTRVNDLNALTAGVCLRYYPAYSRYLEGRFLDFENGIWRRLSLQLSVGSAIHQDPDVSKTVGIVYTAGAGWDVGHGVSLFGGVSRYDYTPAGGDGSKVDSAASFGVSLNAEFWKGLFSKFAK